MDPAVAVVLNRIWTGPATFDHNEPLLLPEQRRALRFAARVAYKASSHVLALKKELKAIEDALGAPDLVAPIFQSIRNKLAKMAIDV